MKIFASLVATTALLAGVAIADAQTRTPLPTDPPSPQTGGASPSASPGGSMTSPSPNAGGTTGSAVGTAPPSGAAPPSQRTLESSPSGGDQRNPGGSPGGMAPSFV
jgi:hypothetical protein